MAARKKNTDTIIEEVSTEPTPDPTPEETTTLNTNELAELFSTDAKTLRRFFRSNLAPEALPGKGGRYAFSKDDLEALQTKFANSGSKRVTPLNFKDAPAEEAAEA